MADAASLLIKLGFRADTGVLRGVESKLDALNNKVRFIAGTEIVRGLFNLTEKFGESAFEIQNAAAAAGITTDALQRLEYAATQSGVEGNKLGESMFHLSRVLYQAKMGGEEAMQTFYQLGIDAQQIDSFKNAEDALYGVMDALKKIDDPIKQQALLEHTMGRGSREMVRFALAGSEAAKSAGNAAAGMGALVGKRALDQLAAARKAMLSLHRIFDAVSSTLGAKFAPVIIWAAETVERFYTQNRKLIDTTFDIWVENAAYALGFFIGAVRTAGGAILRFVNRHKEGVKTILKFAAGVKAISFAVNLLTPALAALGGLSGIAGFLFTAGPIILATLAISGLAAALHDLWLIVSTNGDVKLEDLWLYQLTHGVGTLGKPIQWMIEKVGKLVDFMAPGTFTPAIAGSTVNGMRPDDPRLLEKVRLGNKLSAPGGLLRQLATPPPPTSMSMAAPSTSNYYSESSSQRVINMPVTFNNSNLSPADAMQAVTKGVNQSLTREAELEQANRRFDSPLHY